MATRLKTGFPCEHGASARFPIGRNDPDGLTIHNIRGLIDRRKKARVVSAGWVWGITPIIGKTYQVIIYPSGRISHVYDLQGVGMMAHW